MIKIQCNRCKKEINGNQKVGFIQFSCENPFENIPIQHMSDILNREHYCEDCMDEIWNFMQNKPAVSSVLVDEEPKELKEPKEKEQKEEPKQRYKIDYGKIMALKNAGWPVSKIAEEMGMAAQAVSTAIYQYKNRTEAAQQG